MRRKEGELHALADKLARTSSDIVARTLEERIEELSRKRALLQENAQETEADAVDFGTAFERVRHMLRNPYLLWKEGDLDAKRLVIRLVLTSRLRYDRTTGFGTVELSLPYLISQRIAAGNSALVDPTGESWNRFIATIVQWSLELTF